MSLSPSQTLALALDPTLLFELRGLTPDPWQRELLQSTAPRMLLNCCRQAGKSTAVAALALHTALFRALNKGKWLSIYNEALRTPLNH